MDVYGNLLVKKLDKNAKLPSRGSNDSAGYDLYSLEQVCIQPGEKLLIKTGISIRLPVLPFPFKIYGSIRSRSGLSVKNDLETGAGVIDSDYEGEICVVLRNYGKYEAAFEKHTRIAQMILEIHYVTDIKEVEEFPKLSNQNRTGGFGSTGLN